MPDSTVAERINAALDELEEAYRKPCERIVALEMILHEVRQNRRIGGSPFARYVRVSIERRQVKLSRSA